MPDSTTSKIEDPQAVGQLAVSLHANGLTYRQIGEQIGLSASAVCKIVKVLKPPPPPDPAIAIRLSRQIRESLLQMFTIAGGSVKNQSLAQFVAEIVEAQIADFRRAHYSEKAAAFERAARNEARRKPKQHNKITRSLQTAVAAIHGNDTHRSKISAASADAMRALAADGELTLTAIAARFNVSHTTARREITKQVATNA